MRETGRFSHRTARRSKSAAPAALSKTTATIQVRSPKGVSSWPPKRPCYTFGMSQAEIGLLVLLIVPSALILVLRANATLVFLSLCLGAVMTQFLAPDIKWFANAFLPWQEGLSANALHIFLLLAPPLLTTLLMLQSVRGAKAWLNILPALAVSGLTPLLVVPLLYTGSAQAIMALPLWKGLAHIQDLVVGVGSLISLLFLWIQRSRKPKEDDKKKSA